MSKKIHIKSHIIAEILQTLLCSLINIRTALWKNCNNFVYIFFKWTFIRKNDIDDVDNEINLYNSTMSTHYDKELIKRSIILINFFKNVL